MEDWDFEPFSPEGLKKRLEQLNAPHLKRGLRLIDKGKLDEAYEELMKVFNADQDNGFALQYLASVFLKKGKPTFANRILKDAFWLNGGYFPPFLYLLRAEVNRDLGNIEQWRVNAMKAALYEETEYHARIELADCYYTQGLYELAIDQIDMALELRDKSSSSFLLLQKGICMLKIKRYQEAEDCSKKVIAIQPTYQEAYSLRAEALFHIGRIEEAVEAQMEALACKFKQKEEEDSERCVIVRELLCKKAFGLYQSHLIAMIKKRKYKAEWQAELEEACQLANMKNNRSAKRG